MRLLILVRRRRPSKLGDAAWSSQAHATIQRPRCSREVMGISGKPNLFQAPTRRLPRTCERALQRSESDAHRGYGAFPSVLYRHVLVACLAELGEFDEATAISSEAVRIAEALDNPWSRALAYFAVATVAVQRGDSSRAVAVAAQGVDLCNTYDMRFVWPRLASLTSYAMALAGRNEEGIALTE